jgi:hypothetical protein
MGLLTLSLSSLPPFLPFIVVLGVPHGIYKTFYNISNIITVEFTLHHSTLVLTLKREVCYSSFRRYFGTKDLVWFIKCP